MPVKKSKTPKAGANVKQSGASDAYLRFSFRFFDSSDAELCPPSYRDGYTITLMERLRDLSTWKVSEFTTNKSKSIRAHTHDWARTSRPNGFDLNEQYQDYPGWQFQLTRDEHGRVHGFMIDNTFYIVWLDHDHRLYPS